MNTNTDRVIRPNELAKHLGVTRASISRMMKQGILKKFQITKKAVGVLQSDFDVYLKNARVNPPANAE